MYAIVESGGRQYRTEVGRTIQTEKLPYQMGATVHLDKVLLVSDAENTMIGTPLVEGAWVQATVVDQLKGKKIRVLKYKPGNRYRVRRGHRQQYTRLRIDEIVSGLITTEFDEER